MVCGILLIRLSFLNSSETQKQRIGALRGWAGPTLADWQGKA
jgi:hypothetical protein